MDAANLSNHALECDIFIVNLVLSLSPFLIYTEMGQGRNQDSKLINTKARNLTHPKRFSILFSSSMYLRRFTFGVGEIGVLSDLSSRHS